MSASAQLHRRALLSGAAATLAAPIPAAATHTPLEELIADWRMADAESETLGAEADRILSSADLPTVEVRYGQWRLHSLHQVHGHFAPMIEAWENDRLQAVHVPSLRQRRDELIMELGRQEATRCEAERNCGLTAAEALADHASRRAHGIRQEIIAWRPRDMAEVATKNAWLLQQVRDGLNLRDDLEAIFASEPKKE